MAHGNSQLGSSLAAARRPMVDWFWVGAAQVQGGLVLGYVMKMCSNATLDRLEATQYGSCLLPMECERSGSSNAAGCREEDP